MAMEAPQVFPAIASSFAEAVRCMNAASEGTWGERPALQHITVRVSMYFSQAVGHSYVTAALVQRSSLEVVEY